MKKIIILCCAFCLTTSCSDFLDIKPLDRVSPDQVFKDTRGIKAVFASLYRNMPMEDFNYNPEGGFNYRTGPQGWPDPGWSTSFYTDESTNPRGTSVQMTGGYWAYSALRQINQLIETIPTVSMPMEQMESLLSEAYFIRAYTYFAMAKRYGGVPLITNVQQLEAGDALYVPRSTEKQTWDFILEELDKAIAHLPNKYNAEEGPKRATVWAAYALKSRAALFAASVAKYWDKAPLVGEAVDKKLVGGFTSTDANHYYQECINASLEIIHNSGKHLYKPNPSGPEEAAQNFQKIFENPTDSEVMNEILFSKGFIDGSVAQQKQGHSTDVMFNPSQTSPGFQYYGRFAPTLDLVDLYEDYTDNGEGRSHILSTRTDGEENYSVANPGEGLDLSIPYRKYNNLSDIFAGKDARLFASCILPGSMWKGKEIVIQGGLIDENGNQLIYQDGSVEKDGKIYYTYGGATPKEYSGFAQLGTVDFSNFTSTGFSLRKFLQEGKSVPGLICTSTTDFIDMRLSEVYLNYAEAVLESGLGDQGLAEECLNAIRRRAAHTDVIPLTLTNVLKERRVELAFEGQRYWDLIRRRDSHLLFDGSTMRKALVPILDLREATPQYIFVRANVFTDNRANGYRFNERTYYLPIPGIENNHLVQNPQY